MLQAAPAVGEETLNRFYVLHCIAVPLAALLLIGVHSGACARTEVSARVCRMETDLQEFLEHAAPVIGGFWLAGGALNLVAAALAAHRRRSGRAALWLAVGAGFAILAGLALAGRPAGLPAALKTAIDAALGPVTFTLGAFAALAIFYLGRRVLVIPAVAWAGLDAVLVWFGLSLADPHFAAIVGKPDNLPIVAMVCLLGFFTWLATRQARGQRRSPAAQAWRRWKRSTATPCWSGPTSSTWS